MGASSLLPSNFALEYSVGKIGKNQGELKFSGVHQLLIRACDVNVLDRNIKATN
jgi:hypothetical protein